MPKAKWFDENKVRFVGLRRWYRRLSSPLYRRLLICEAREALSAAIPYVTQPSESRRERLRYERHSPRGHARLQVLDRPGTGRSFKAPSLVREQFSGESDAFDWARAENRFFAQHHHVCALPGN